MARNRLTLLQIVQRVLDAMNHDSVNSISDTLEATQIAEEARVTYYDLMDRDDWAHLMQLKPLEGVGDTDRPNFLKIPQDVVRIDEFRYEITKTDDTSRRFRRIEYCHPTEFLERTFTRNNTNTDVDVIQNSNDVEMFILNDEPPSYWTSFDDEFIVCDAYDSAQDTTLQSSKSLVLAKVIPTWTSSDTFVPDMPDQMFSVFLAEVTSAAFLYWKEGQSLKDEQRAARGIARLRKDSKKVDEYDGKARYGRRRTGVYGSEDGVRGSARRTARGY